MAISDDDIARVKAQTDIVGVISEKVPLRKVGQRFTGLCPFHGEKTPSFSVNPQLGLYYCFGCQAKGDAIRFVQETEQLSFVEAVEKLAAACGVVLTEDTSGAAGRRKERRDLIDAVAEAAEFYHQRLLRAPDAGQARGYLRSRGYDGEVIRRFGLGWAPNGWDVMVKSVRHSSHDLVRAGLAFPNRSGHATDFFRGRLLFPIANPTGDVISFGGRILPGQDGPKYKNTSQTPLYDKSNTLYGLHLAKKQMATSGVGVLCEGYTDVIAFHLAGVETAVATCGTAATKDHIKLLQRMGVEKLILAYDADVAGQAANDRFHEWERVGELTVHVLGLPAGQDPADLGRLDPGALVRAVEEAKPFVRYQLERILATVSGSATMEAKARVAAEAMAVVARHPNAMVRDQYTHDVADRLRMDHERLQEVGVGRQRHGGRQAMRRRAEEAAGMDKGGTGYGLDLAPARRPRPAHSAPQAEMDVLWFVVHEPQAVWPYLDEVLFTDELCADAFHARASTDTWEGALDADTTGLLYRFANEDHPGWEPVDVVSTLVRKASERALTDLEREARTAKDPLEALGRLAGEICTVRAELERLRHSRSHFDDGTVDPERQEAIEALVTWLTQRRPTEDES